MLLNCFGRILRIISAVQHDCAGFVPVDLHGLTIAEGRIISVLEVLNTYHQLNIFGDLHRETGIRADILIVYENGVYCRYLVAYIEFFSRSVHLDADPLWTNRQGYFALRRIQSIG